MAVGAGCRLLHAGLPAHLITTSSTRRSMARSASRRPCRRERGPAGGTDQEWWTRFIDDWGALQRSPFFALWASATIDEILSALHRRLLESPLSAPSSGGSPPQSESEGGALRGAVEAPLKVQLLCEVAERARLWAGAK